MEAPLRTLGRYTLLRRLAAGGMGEVYLGEMQGAANFTKRVALKRILPHLARMPDFVDKFIDEANVMVQLHHGNVVPVQELVEQDGELFLVMEYVPGRDLKAVLHRLRAQKRVWSPDLAAWVISEICAGLDYAHRRIGPDGQPLGIVHRDVSPSNVVLGAGGEVKLLDFGIARARGRIHQSISGTLQGKFVYMSPEQADGRRVDRRSDVFSAGLVLYEMLSGVRPMEGESETETLRRVRDANIEPPSRVRAELPAELDAVVMKALRREPDDRYPSAGDMRREIQHYLGATRSSADAGALSRFLGSLFPEGVVPPAMPDEPMSLDDALNAQLGALTPSFDLANTRTATGPGSTPAGASALADTAAPPLTPSGPVSLPAADPSRPPPAVATTGEIPTHVTDIRPQRRVTIVAVLALVVAVGAAVWSLVPKSGSLDVTIAPEAAATIATYTLDGQPWTPGTEVRAGRRYTFCALAEGYEEQCKEVPVFAGDNALSFTLKLPPPELRRVTFRVEPSSAQAELEIDGVDFRPRAPHAREMQIGAGGWVKARAEGYAPGESRFAVTRDGPDEFVVELAAIPPPPDAGPPPVDAAPKPRPPVVAATPRPHLVEIKCSAPDAVVFAGGERLGRAPQKVTVLGQPVPARVEAPGYVAKRLSVTRSSASTLDVELDAEARGVLIVRAKPPAAQVFIDGRMQSDYPVQGSFTAGEHTVEARHPIEGVWRVDRRVVTVKTDAPTKVYPEVTRDSPELQP